MGFRVNSARAIQFRQWATGVLRDFAIRGYVLDKERLKNGAFLSKEYYEIVQDRLFESDFDRHLKKALKNGEADAERRT